MTIFGKKNRKLKELKLLVKKVIAREFEKNLITENRIF